MLGLLKRFAGDRRGTAAIETAAVGSLLIFGALNVAEVGRYAYQASEVNAAAQAGAEAAIKTCDTDHTPATLNCSGLKDAVTAAIQGTRLGSQISLDGAITEGYYCLTTTGGMGQASSASSSPADCSGVANAAGSAKPTLYLQVHVTCPFQPLFPGLTLAQTFQSAITRTAWMRMI
jgi:Flp pilus assembly protein TadG